MKQAQFTVDAALLRELGDRLIGQSHIALAELVKNAYDADAHVCRIEIRDDAIVVSDDGHGISEREFHDFWMRIGTTHKVDLGKSRRLGRPMTGSKGLGRLSAQYLAEETVLESTASGGSGEMLYALVDWRNVRSGKDLETVSVAWEMRDEVSQYADDSPIGTRIRLQSLRSKWDSEAIEDLGRVIWMLRPPRRYRNRRSHARDASDFFVDLDAPEIDEAEASFDERHMALLDNWKARISGVLEDGRRTRGSRASITVEFKGGYPEGSGEPRTVHEDVALPVRRRHEDESTAVDRARFEILVFKTEGRQTSGLSVGEVREYLRKFGNVSVYDAGFRLPYYGSSKDLTGQDWLNVAIDQGRRLIVSELLPEHLRMNRYMLDLPAPGRIFGSVEVDTNHEHSIAVGIPGPGDCLRIQPGRDRLAQNAAFEQLRDLVRFSLDLYANRYRALAEESADRKRAKEPPRRLLDGAVKTLDRHRDDIPPNVFSDVRREVVGIRRAVDTEEKSLDRRAVLLAPLATAGMAALAFNHELAREAQTLREIKEALEQMAAAENNPDLERLASRLDAFGARFQSYRELFSPLAEPEDRQAANRLRVYSVVSQVVDAVRSRMPGVLFHYHGAVDRELRFPRGSFVEWSALLQNVVFNAWNAMLDSSRRAIRFETVGLGRGRTALRVSDTGVGLAVPLEEAGMLFEPFERRVEIAAENRSIAIGGEGLGLAIVRMIAARREAEVGFRTPPSGYSTTFEMAWKG